MNILIINHYAGSPNLGMEYRHYYLAKEWIKKNHNVTIIAASFSHLRSTQPVITGKYEEEELEKVKYIWLKTPSYTGNGVRRIWNMLIFILRLLIYSKKIEKRVAPDVVIASSTYLLDIFPACRISRKSKSRLIFEVHDLWPLSLIELGNYSKYNPFIILLQYAENFAYRNSDHIVSILPMALSHMVKHGLLPQKFNYIPNGVDVKSWNSNEPVPEAYKAIIRKLKSENNVLVGYTGSIGISNAMDCLVESARILKNENISFLVVGSGSEKQKLVQKVSDYQLSNFIFLHPLPKTVMPALLREMDLVYIGWKKLLLYTFGISPNKLIDYMMAAKPVILSIESGNNLVEESGCGISIKAENPESIADAIKTIAKLDEKSREIIGLRGREFVLQNLDYEFLSKKFIDILES